MKQYRVLETESGSVKVVKLGWSWPGFLFTWIWALSKGLWLIGASLLLVNILLVEMEAPVLIGLKSIVVCLLFGSRGNSWVEKRINKKGIKASKIVTTEDKEKAISKYHELKRADDRNQETEKAVGGKG